MGGGNPDVVRQKLGVLKAHCDTLGRDYNSIVRSTNLNTFLLEDGSDPEKATAKARGARSYADYSRDVLVATKAQLTGRIQQLIDAGADYINFYLPRVAYDQSSLQRIAAEIIPQFS